MKNIESTNQATWQDVIAFAETHNRIGIVQDGKLRSAFAPVKFLEIAHLCASDDKAAHNIDWRPWLNGTLDGVTVVSLVQHDTAETRWLIPA